MNCVRPYLSYLIGLSLLGCGGSNDSGKCVPGASLECACAPGVRGIQVCTEQKILGQCMCETMPIDALPAGTGGAITPPLTGGAGAAGQSGAAGVPGFAGVTALAGATGPAGATALAGATGLAGATALAGTTGVAGATGLAGALAGAAGGAIPPVGGKTSSPDAGVPSPDGPISPPDSAVPSDTTISIVVRCGDGVVTGPEPCDDGNAATGDGCTPDCLVEPGFICSGSPSYCRRNGCGNGAVDPGEMCDDGNTLPFDGCSQDCRYEPICNGTSCTSRCGDGIVLGEDCDDGNLADGDGCSKACKTEPGFACAQPALGEKITVPVIYRDFQFHKPFEFEPTASGITNPALGMVRSTLDEDGKPVFMGITGTGTYVTSATTFSQWYRTTDGVNHATSGKLALYDNGGGGYVNRYGSNGEQWVVTEPAFFCGALGSEQLDSAGKAIPCTYLYMQTDCDKKLAEGKQMLSCTLESSTYKATFVSAKVDGNPLFFPVDGDTFSPASERSAAKIPPSYSGDTMWPFEVDATGNKVLHNFSFTSEVRYWFVYDENRSYTLSFTGDDDVWVFINRKLALDLGGIHTPADGKVTIDATTAATLGLLHGKVYEVAVFQAERQTYSSTYKLTLTGFNTAPSQCVRQ